MLLYYFVDGTLELARLERLGAVGANPKSNEPKLIKTLPTKPGADSTC